MYLSCDLFIEPRLEMCGVCAEDDKCKCVDKLSFHIVYFDTKEYDVKTLHTFELT